MLGVMFLLTACTSSGPMEVTTRLIADEKFNGQRAMSITIDSKSFKSWFDEDIEKLNTLIKENCPADMYGNAVENEDGSVTVIMTIPFASYEEYYDKVMRVFNANSYDPETEPTVYFEYSDSLLKKGFTIEENFSSVELCYWLVDALAKDNSKMENKTIEELFIPGKTMFVFGQQELETDSCIAYSHMESNALEHVRVETTLNDTGSYDVIVDFYVSMDVWNKLGIQLSETMASLVPEGGVFATKTTSERKVFTIKVTAVSTADYCEKLNQILHTDNTVFEVIEENDETDTLKARKIITQYLDGSYFLDFSDGNTKMTYVLKASPEHSFENCESLYNYVQQCTYENTESYCGTYVDVNPADQITVNLGYSVDIDKIEVNTIMHSPINFERHMKFTLTSEQNRIIGQRFEERIQDRLTDTITYEKTPSGGGYVYQVVIMADSAESLSKQTSAFLDGYDSSNSQIFGGQSDENRLKKITYEFTDQINFMTFLSGSQATKGFYYRFEYPKKYMAHFVENSNHENILEDANVLTCITYNKVIDVKSYAEKTNWIGISQRILWWLSFVGMFVVILLNVPAILKCIKKRQLDMREFDLFSKKGYTYCTIFALCLVIFAVATIRLMFKVY